MPPSATCTASRKPDGYIKAHLQEFGQVIQALIISQIPGGPEGLDQLIYDDNTLRGSILPTAGGGSAFIAQVTLYSAALCVAISQACNATGEHQEQAVLKKLLGELNLEGVLIQADALHIQHPFFNASRRRWPTSSRR